MARGGTAKRVASNRNRGSRAAYAFTEKAVHCRCQPFLGGWGARIKHGRINGWMDMFGGVLRVSETLFVDSSSTSRCVWGKPEEGPQRGREEIWPLAYGVHAIPTRRPMRTKYLVYSVHFGPRQTVTALLYNLPVANIAICRHLISSHQTLTLLSRNTFNMSDSIRPASGSRVNHITANPLVDYVDV